MPFFPTVQAQTAQRRVTDVFAGYNHNLRINEGEFYDEENLCSDDYPLLSTRRLRRDSLPRMRCAMWMGRSL